MGIDKQRIQLSKSSGVALEALRKEDSFFTPTTSTSKIALGLMITLSFAGTGLASMAIGSLWPMLVCPVLMMVIILGILKKISYRLALYSYLSFHVVQVLILIFVYEDLYNYVKLISFFTAVAAVYVLGARKGLIVAMLLMSGVVVEYYLLYSAGSPPFSVIDLAMFMVAILGVFSVLFLNDDNFGAWVKRTITKEQEVANFTQRLSAIMGAAGEGMLATDENGVINYVNEEAEQLLRTHRNALLGQKATSLPILFNSSHQPYIEDSSPLTIVLQNQVDVRYDLSSRDEVYVKQNKDFVQVALAINPIFSANKELIGTITVLKNVTVDAEFARAKSEFASLASHQLRTPVNSAKWYIEKLQNPKHGPLNAKQKEFLGEIQAGNKYVMELITDLLNVSRAELNAIEVAGHEVDPLEILRQVHSSVSLSASQKSVTLTVTRDQNIPKLLRSDRKLVKVIYDNLFTNAIKYTPKGEVRVHLWGMPPGKPPRTFGSRVIAAPNGGVVLMVKDSGIGIPKDQHSKIFQKLFRANNALTTNVDGTGLGMYMSKQFANELDGDIWFESVEGVGSVFFAYLPNTAA